MLGSYNSRQSFLGPTLARICERCTIGIVGLGGGGSHIAQQLAHVGFVRYLLIDPDSLEESNLNRLVGGTRADVVAHTPKVQIARRNILGVQPGAAVDSRENRWQDVAKELHDCDIIFGCLDGLSLRDQLEAVARRYLIPYIDIGLGVLRKETRPPRMSGQVAVSIPGGPCLRCLGMLRGDVLEEEANAYGDAGPHPQVVWANGVLASTAVGLALELLTQWTGRATVIPYYSYDGNRGIMVEHPTLEFVPRGPCVHYPIELVGPVRFR